MILIAIILNLIAIPSFPKFILDTIGKIGKCTGICTEILTTNVGTQTVGISDGNVHFWQMLEPEEINAESLIYEGNAIENFTKIPRQTIIPAPYEEKNTAPEKDFEINNVLQNILKSNPQGCPPETCFLYYTGNSDNFSRLIQAFRTHYPNVKNMRIFGGDSAFDQKDFLNDTFSDFMFTSYAYPQVWSMDSLVSKGVPTVVSNFMSIYAQTFDPRHTHPDAFGFSLANSNTIMVYDAFNMLISSYAHAGSGSAIQNALRACNPFQGISGSITFTPDGNPLNKTILMLHVDEKGHVTMSDQGILQGNILESSPSPLCPASSS